jgi:large subunit ribosomal protein L5e
VKLVTQDKNKYQTPKYRFVVRFSNKDITVQVFSSDLIKDTCLASAYSHELRRYGISLGLTNYAAAYATGLLLARRIDRKFMLGYAGNLRIDGKEYHVVDDGQGLRPFKALLDVGLVRTTTGARVFGALKGAADGGLNIPHNTRRFPGSSRNEDSKKWEYEPEEHRRYIFGQHVADYMRHLQENDPKQYQRQFSKYIASKIKADDLEKLYAKAHQAIRNNPNLARGALEKGRFGVRAQPKGEVVKKHWGKKPISLEQRRSRIKQILQAQHKEAIVRLVKKKY